MKRKWWILGSIVIAAVVSLCFFSIRLRIAPRWILSRALGSAITQLDSRFEKSPVRLLEGVLDPQGRQKIDLTLDMETPRLGAMHWDMQLMTQAAPNRILGDGTVVAAGKALDLSVYLDESFAAVSSEGLLEGNYYGITYNTFSRDIRSRTFLATLIGEKTITGWENSVSNLDKVMSSEVQLPEWESEDVVSALYGLLALKPHVSRVDTPAGAAAKTDAVIFRATGQEIAELTAAYRNQMPPAFLTLIDEWKTDESAFVEVTFFLYKGGLVEIYVLMETAMENTLIFVTLGTDPEKDKLAMELKRESGENYNRIRVEIESASDEVTYREKVRIWINKDREQTKTSLEYAYNSNIGEMDLIILRDAEEARIRLNLAGKDDSLTIRSQNVSPLLNLFLKKPLESPAICTLTVSPGFEAAVPEYRNLDQWSMEDLFVLLGGFGSLLGLQLP